MARARATLAAVGDVFPSRSPFDDGPSRDREFAKVVERLQASDIAFCNYELPISTRGMPLQKAITIRTPSPERAADVRRMGFGVVSLANNHIFDYGAEALADTVSALDHAGVRHVGAGADLMRATRPVVVEAAGVRFGFLAWSTLLPLGAVAGERCAGVASLQVRAAYEVDPVRLAEEPMAAPVVRTWVDAAAEARAVAQVAALRTQADHVIASVHWGADIGDKLEEYQQPLGRRLIEAGADVVLGNHPHNVLGVEVYGGKPILYSPGLFLEQVPRAGADERALALYAQLSPDSYIARLEFADGAPAELRLVPTSSNEDGLPQLARGAVFERIFERLRRLSKPLGTELTLEAEEIVVPLD